MKRFCTLLVIAVILVILVAACMMVSDLTEVDSPTTNVKLPTGTPFPTIMEEEPTSTPFPTILAEECILKPKEWNLAEIDSAAFLPNYSELIEAGAELLKENESAVALQDYWYTLTLDGIKYFTPGSLDEPWYKPITLAIISSDYSLSCGISVGSTEKELLELFPSLEKSNVKGTETEGLGHFFRIDQFPNSFLEEYDYALSAFMDKGTTDALPTWIAFLIKEEKVQAITVYLPTAS